MNSFGHTPPSFPDREDLGFGLGLGLGLGLATPSLSSLISFLSALAYFLPFFVFLPKKEDSSTSSNVSDLLSVDNSWEVDLIPAVLISIILLIMTFGERRQHLGGHYIPHPFNMPPSPFNDRVFEPMSLETNSWHFKGSIYPDYHGCEYINHNRNVNFPKVVVERYSDDLYNLIVHCNRANAGAYAVLLMCLLSGVKEVEQIRFAQSLSQGAQQVTVEGSPENMFICLNNIITVLNNIEKSICDAMADHMFSFLTPALIERAKAGCTAYDATQSQRALDFLQSMFPDILAPAELFCSITQALMTRVVSYKNNGVTQSFEESAILEWLSRQSTDPLARNRLASFMLSRDKQKERDINEFLYQPEFMTKVANRFLFNSLSTTLNHAQHVRDVCSVPYFFKESKADSNDLRRKPSMLLLTNG